MFSSNYTQIFRITLFEKKYFFSKISHWIRGVSVLWIEGKHFSMTNQNDHDYQISCIFCNWKLWLRNFDLKFWPDIFKFKFLATLIMLFWCRFSPQNGMQSHWYFYLLTAMYMVNLIGNVIGVLRTQWNTTMELFLRK